jgi:hypothetical protein
MEHEVERTVDDARAWHALVDRMMRQMHDPDAAIEAAAVMMRDRLRRAARAPSPPRG